MPALNAPAGGTARVRMKRQGSTAFSLIPGASAYNETGGDATRRTIRAFEGTAQVQGKQTPPTIAGTLAAVSALHPTYIDMKKAGTEGTTREFLLTVAESLAFSPAATARIAIEADDGVVTFSGTGSGSDDPDVERIAPGMALKVGTGASAKYYVLDTVKGYEGEAATVVVDAADNAFPDNDVAATAYTVVGPPLKREFSSFVALADRPSIDVEGEVSGTFSLTPSSDPAWQLNI